MSAAPHVIEHQQVRLRLAPGTDGRAVQKQVEAVLQSPSLLDALDAALSSVGYTDDWLTIDYVELDLGQLDSTQLENQLLDRLPGLLRQQVAEAWAAASSSTGRADATKLRTAAGTAWAAWLYFLQQGSLPTYWPAPATIEDWETELLALLAALAPPQRARLRTLLASATVRQRLMRQFSPLLNVAVISALDATALPHQPLLAEALTPLLYRQDSYSGELGELLMLELLRRASMAEASNWLALLTILAPHKRLARPDVLTQLAQEALAVVQMQVQVPTPTNSTEKTATEFTIQREAKILDQEQVNIKSEVQHSFITNAGVVLLHPFLPTCFAACGWLADDKFINETARMKAVLLVHFLATGAAQAAEFELQLPKLLCGVPAGTVPNRRLRLGRAAQAEGMTLLSAAIEHWSALKNTSPAGLREAFLQREGKLETAPDGHSILTVEQRAQDVLLDRLPYGWGLGVVQQPWMPSRLTIHWS